MDTVKIMLPTAEYADQIAAFRREFLDSGSSMDGTGPLRRQEDPLAWIAECELFTRPETTPAGRVPATQFLTVREGDNTLVGMIQIRHSFNDYLAEYGGHIGYCVRPGERRKGYAAQQLRQALVYCKEALGMDRVLITCLADNEGSRRTILNAGGVYDRTTHEPNENVDLERYWIELT